jgi:putative hemolysin
LSLLVLLVVLASGCAPATPVAAPTPTPDAGAQIANPASKFCVDKGYRSEIRTGKDGQYGVCIFPDGTECDEWAFFRGECAPGTPKAGDPAASLTVEVPELGLVFSPPPGYSRMGSDWVWVSDQSPTTRVGLVWGAALPGREPEAMLPSGGVMMGREDGTVVPWGTAATYKLQVMAEGGTGRVKAFEAHVLGHYKVMLLDWFASGADESELAEARLALTRMLGTAVDR